MPHSLSFPLHMPVLLSSPLHMPLPLAFRLHIILYRKQNFTYYLSSKWIFSKPVWLTTVPLAVRNYLLCCVL
jgi:hypothetical protein